MNHLKRSCCILAALLSWAVSLEGSDVPPPLRDCVALIRNAEVAPTVRKMRTVSGVEVPTVSREGGLLTHLDKEIAELRKNADELRGIETVGGAWADDAAVLRGFLYTATAADILWAPEMTVKHYRLLIQRPKEIHLEPWTEKQLKHIPWIAYLWSDREEGASDTELIADFFAGQFIGHYLVAGDSKLAGDQLSAIKQSGRLSQSIIRELSLMITFYEKDHNDSSRNESE